ncbi:MAG: hypothetical protein ABUL66_01510 [Verrucomicrobiota bacterium]
MLRSNNSNFSVSSFRFFRRKARLIFARLIGDSWTAFAGAAASPDKLFFISFFLMIAVRVSPYAACFTNAETFYEVTPVYFRRAWGMTAKDAALPDSWVAGVAHAFRRRK